MKLKDNGNDSGLPLRCPKCGYEIPMAKTRAQPLLTIGTDTRKIRNAKPSEVIVARGNAAFQAEASKRGWSIFGYVTLDVGIDYMIAKGYGTVMIQLKTATLMEDGRYHVTVGKFLEGPLGFIVYHFQDIDAFFLIPTTKFWEIPRFTKLKERVFEGGKYSDTMSYEKAKEVMGDYEGEKGWALLERLTTPEGLLKAIKDFIDKRKRSEE